MIFTGIIIQVFMLRNMKVAGVLRAESIEEETKVRQKINNFTCLYIPVYAFLVLSIYILEILVMAPPTSIKNDYSLQNIILGVYILLNTIKLSFSAYIGITTYKFAASINKLI